MIGIVVVSHSRALAQAAVALATEMVGDDGPVIEVAAGLDETTLGTDAAAVAEAITSADEASGGAGVLVLLDLGSAVLSAEMALEFIDPDVAGRVRLSSAPLVEGLVAATVTAGTGADLAQVAAEAGQGLAAKVSQLGDTGAAPRGDDADGAAGGGPEPSQEVPPDAETELAVTGAHGLHARPAAALVACVNRYPDVEVLVSNPESGRGPVNARSVTAVATLDARQGHRLRVMARGAQAGEVVAALEELAAQQFGEAEEAVTPAARPERPEPAAGVGVDAAIGTAHRRRSEVDVSGYLPGDVALEQRRLQQAIERVTTDLEQLQQDARERVGDAEAQVFAAHLAILTDPGLRGPVQGAIESGEPATSAWQRQSEESAAQFEALAEAYQRERAQDVRSVARRVLRALVPGAESEDPPGEGPWVLVVDELDPAEAVHLDGSRYTGVVTVRGGATGHGILLARSRGVPVLPGARAGETVRSGQLLAFDVRSAQLWVEPSPQQVAEVEALIDERSAQYGQAAARAQEPARTSDGLLVGVKANIGAVDDALASVGWGAEGSGLVRTELLFADRATAPDVAEQVRVFTEIAEAFGGRPITIRTWDIGGDKPLPFLPMAVEQNPFLGVRGIRAMSDNAALLLDQLEAICRVAMRHPVRVMFPMVATVAEVEWALERLDEAAGRLPDGRPDGLEVGIMVEVPAAALRAEALTVHLDFVSIGSNDLTQYTLAADRGNAGVAGLADSADPAVLALIRTVCEDVAEGVEVCLCGDAASDPALAGLLVGLGVGELSASPASVPVVKAAIRASSAADLRDLAERALHCDSAAEVRALLR